MTETRDTMLRRLHMRSMRRGIKEMDLILPAFAATHLQGMDNLALYDALLSENDHDLYQWVTGLEPCPARYTALISLISASAFAAERPAG